MTVVSCCFSSQVVVVVHRRPFSFGRVSQCKFRTSMSQFCGFGGVLFDAQYGAVRTTLILRLAGGCQFSVRDFH